MLLFLKRLFLSALITAGLFFPFVSHAAGNGFFTRPVDNELKRKITGVSFPDTEEPSEISYDDLAYIHVLHYDFNGQIRDGHLICNKKIAPKVATVFRELYEKAYPVEKIRLIEEYGGNDNASMEDNNTSCFNYRKIAGTNKLSNHSYGLALDINPLYNPYVKTARGKTIISPDKAEAYADRSKAFAHKIDQNDLAYRVFIKHGFVWGGDWKSVKDYQHFEYTDKE